jgi:hypothetical protein
LQGYFKVGTALEDANPHARLAEEHPLPWPKEEQHKGSINKLI